MPLITLSNGTQFCSEPGESILNAAARGSFAMAYRCSSCKYKVLEGRSVPLHEEQGLSQEEKAEGWILSCVRTVESDLHLEAEDLGGVVPPVARTLPCRIHGLEKLADDVVKVVLRLPPTSEFAFLPGQYIDVLGQGGVRRSYSLANADAQAKQLELHIRAVPGGAMSEYWFGQARINDLLRLNGPLGTFFLRNIAGLHLVFLATGTGIAPVKSMLESLESLAPDRHPRSVTVYWGARLAPDLYWDVQASTALSAMCRCCRAQLTNGPARAATCTSTDGRRPGSRENGRVACGSDAMIHSAKELPTTAGLPERHFFSDAFVCSA